MTVLLTGATGQLGTALAPVLDGPRLLVRARAGHGAAARLARTGRAPVDPDAVVEGDVTAEQWGLGGDADLGRLRGVRTIVHAAAATNWAAPWSDLHRGNLVATLEGLALARRLAAREGATVTFVLVGSALASYSAEGWLTEERHPLYPRAHAYERSKWQAEQALLATPVEGVRRVLVRTTSIAAAKRGTDTTARRQGPYLLVDAARRSGRRTIVGNPRARADIVPRDEAARGLAALVDRADALPDGFIGHLCLGETAPSVASLVAAMNDLRHHDGGAPFRLVPLPERALLGAADVARRIHPFSERALNAVTALRYVSAERWFARDRMRSVVGDDALPAADPHTLARLLLGASPVAALADPADDRPFEVLGGF